MYLTTVLRKLIMELVTNREGWLMSETERQCTNCLIIFPRTSKTVTLCGVCNSGRVKTQSPVLKMWRRAKARAKETGREFEILPEDIIIPATCPILGMVLVCYSGRSGGQPDSPSLDRVDSTKGYTKDNIMVVSHLANMMKSFASPEQLIKFAEWALDTYK